MGWNLTRSIFAGWCLLMAASPVVAVGAVLQGAAAGELMTAPSGAGDAELVNLDAGLAPSLLSLPIGGSTLVADWPVAPGERREVELTRFDVYSPDARIVKIEGSRMIELPRSRFAFFLGGPADDPGTRLVVPIDPATRDIAGLATTEGGMRELRSWKTAGDDAYVVAATDGFRPAGAEEPEFSCGQQTDSLTRSVFSPSLSAQGLAPGGAKAITSLHTATIAVDTDNELMNLKFSNNSTAATNYIANLIARMNIMYERDLLVRLVQGFTILRPSTTADPYNQSGTGNADGNKLNEFSNYWSGGCGGACTGVSRALAMMLSGKQSGTNSASGIAWVNGLCSTGIGYSFTQVFKFAQDTSGSDGSIVGHEVGHNFGSPHTHCYSPPIDQCYNAEGGCYSGGTSCPAPATYNGVPNVTGTVMSYCHLTGCGSTEVFHPRTIDLIAPLVQSRVGQCIFPLGPANTIFNNGFEGGTLPSPWSAKVP